MLSICTTEYTELQNLLGAAAETNRGPTGRGGGGGGGALQRRAVAAICPNFVQNPQTHHVHGAHLQKHTVVLAITISWFNDARCWHLSMVTMMAVLIAAATVMLMVAKTTTTTTR